MVLQVVFMEQIEPIGLDVSTVVSSFLDTSFDPWCPKRPFLLACLLAT